MIVDIASSVDSQTTLTTFHIRPAFIASPPMSSDSVAAGAEPALDSMCRAFLVGGFREKAACARAVATRLCNSLSEGIGPLAVVIA